MPCHALPQALVFLKRLPPFTTWALLGAIAVYGVHTMEWAPASMYRNDSHGRLGALRP
jgi:hypothetical protein